MYLFICFLHNFFLFAFILNSHMICIVKDLFRILVAKSIKGLSARFVVRVRIPLEAEYFLNRKHGSQPRFFIIKLPSTRYV